MDESEKQYFDGLLGAVNTKLEDILDRLSTARTDIQNNQGHIVYALEDSLSLGRRITKLEDEIRRLRPPAGHVP
jgi:hypothetical protein